MFINILILSPWGVRPGNFPYGAEFKEINRFSFNGMIVALLLSATIVKY